MIEKFINKLTTPTYPTNKPMFYPGYIKRTDGLDVDNTLIQLNANYATNPDHIHGTFHRLASISDLEPTLYNHCTNNPTSIGNWLPPLIKAHRQTNNPALHIPTTRTVRLDHELAQYLRVEFSDTNKLSQHIFDAYLFNELKLDDTDYFIKTGTFSGKFQFANAHCTEPDEIGQYFHVINNFAMSVGAGETVDLAIRDYIPDTRETTPTIYNGMPLRCEYRLFIDFGDNPEAHNHTEPTRRAAYAHKFADPHEDTDNCPAHIMGITHYWHRRVMRQHFAMLNNPEFAGYSGINPQDAATYRACEAELDAQFDQHLDSVRAGAEELLPGMYAEGFRGQWSMDVMVNAADTGEVVLYLIDMALMCESALSDELDTVDELRYVPVEDIRTAAGRKILWYAPAPDFVPGSVVDGHGVEHEFVQGSAEKALRWGVEKNLLSTDGSSVPFLETLPRSVD